MSSSSKRQQTMAKMNRERMLAERRVQKQERKDARKQAAAAGEDGQPTDEASVEQGLDGGAPPTETGEGPGSRD